MKSFLSILFIVLFYYVSSKGKYDFDENEINFKRTVFHELENLKMIKN